MYESVGSRGVMFKLEHIGSTVYLIETDKKLFLCDTDTGPLSMIPIVKYIISQQLIGKDVVIFNSHSDWDHIWGNCAFEDATILAHKDCNERMGERGEYLLEILPAEFKNGEITLVYPNLTFEKRLLFEEEDVEFIYAPGHTVDSAICFDRKDSVLYIGDLVESPIPYLNYHDLSVYLDTLNYIKDMKAKTIITTHSGIVDESLIDSNIRYIRNFLEGVTLDFSDEGAKMVHEFNLRNYQIAKCDYLMKKTQGKDFDFRKYRDQLWERLVKYGDGNTRIWDISKFRLVDLQKVVEEYLSEML